MTTPNSASAARKDQAFTITYIAAHYPTADLAMVQAVQRHASLWALDAREALALFDSKPPKNVQYLAAIGPGSVPHREDWIDFTEEERRRVAGGSALIK